MQFNEKVAIVTGGSAGIGFAIAKALVTEGAKVVLAARDAERGQAAVTQLGSAATFFATDIEDPQQCKALVEHTVKTFGGLDLAVNNAGLGRAGKLIADEDVTGFEKVLKVNISGTFACMQHEIPQMIARGGGAIVNVSSVSGVVAGPGQSAYITAKHGLIGLTKAAALEYVKQGIRVNAVCPVATRTSMVERWFEMPGVRDRVLASIPAGRIAEPDEVAAATLFLLSNQASFVTGQALAVDGGFVAQ